MKDIEFESLKISKLKIRRRGPDNSAIFRPKKLGLLNLICVNFEKVRKSLLNHVKCIEIWSVCPYKFENWNIERGTKEFNLMKFWETDKSPLESCRVSWDVTNHVKSPHHKKFSPSSLICGEFEKLRKSLLSQVKDIEIWLMTHNLHLYIF